MQETHAHALDVNRAVLLFRDSKHKLCCGLQISFDHTEAVLFFIFVNSV